MNTGIYDGAVAAAAAQSAVPAAWILAVIGAESSFQVDPPRRWEPKVNEHAYGPMQILLSTARGLGFTGTGAQLEDPATNIAVGAALLAELRGRYGADFARVYSAYNSGDPDRWLSSDQVAANVARATRWLRSFDGAGGAEVAALVGAAGLVWWWWRTRRAS